MIRLSSYVELLYDKGITKQYLRGLYTVVQSLHEFLEENINYLKENGLYNEIDTIEGANGPEIKINGKSYINLSSNNYLGLATNEDLNQLQKQLLIHMV